MRRVWRHKGWPQRAPTSSRSLARRAVAAIPPRRWILPPSSKTSFPCHISCLDPRENIRHLKEKQDAGADFFITQLFFDNNAFFRFREQAQAAGVTIPIVCGVMPFLGKGQIQRMIFMCGSSLPSAIIKLLAKYEDNPEALRQAGIRYACEQLVELARQQVDGLHVYAMNQPDIALAAAEALRAEGFRP